MNPICEEVDQKISSRQNSAGQLNCFPTKDIATEINEEMLNEMTTDQIERSQ